MSKKANAFTIVELLIVIVVIAILAAISIVSYTGIQQRAKNTERYNEIKSWQRVFEVYRAQHGSFPDMAAGNYCLGVGFPSGSTGGNVPRCRDWNSVGNGYAESGNAALMTALSEVATLPNSEKVAIGRIVGPWVTYSATIIYFNLIVYGSTVSDCPAQDMTSSWSGDGAVWCRFPVNR